MDDRGKGLELQRDDEQAERNGQGRIRVALEGSGELACSRQDGGHGQFDLESE